HTCAARQAVLPALRYPWAHGPPEYSREQAHDQTVWTTCQPSRPAAELRSRTVHRAGRDPVPVWTDQSSPLRKGWNQEPSLPCRGSRGWQDHLLKAVLLCSVAPPLLVVYQPATSQFLSCRRQIQQGSD